MQYPLALRPGQVLTANYREAALARKPVFVALQIETRAAYRSVLKNVRRLYVERQSSGLGTNTLN